MISRIKKAWRSLCDILEGPKEYSGPDPFSYGQKVITFDPEETDYSYGGPWDCWPMRWVLVKGEERPHIGYPRRRKSIYRDPGFSDTLDLF